jgi:hypothetical protein
MRRCSAAFHWREGLPPAAIVYVSSAGVILISQIWDCSILDLRLLPDFVANALNRLRVHTVRYGQSRSISSLPLCASLLPR